MAQLELPERFTHYTDHHFDPFVNEIGSNYLSIFDLYLESMNISKDDTMEIKKLFNSPKYERAVDYCAGLIKDFIKDRNIFTVTRLQMEFIALKKQDGTTYFVRGFDEYRIFDSFYRGEIKLAGFTYDDFLAAKNSYRRGQNEFNFRLTYIQIKNKVSLDLVKVFVDRYEPTDSELLGKLDKIQEMFLF